MTEPGSLLQELAIVAILGAAVTALLSRLRLPTVAGLIASGALLGPFGLKLVHRPQAIEVLADVGVVLLLFTIGLEFSLERLRHIFHRVALGGAVQVLLTIAATVAVARLAGESREHALFYGFVFAMSSTAIVLRALAERGEVDAPHGRFIVGTLILQDLCVVPMVLLVPVLGSDKATGDVVRELGLALGKAALVVICARLLARHVVPRLLRWVDASRSRDIFLLAILAICVGTTWLTSLAGLSLALGAFLGGMVVADTEFQHRAMGDMIPLRDAFVSMFFISLGMLFDVHMLIAHPWLVSLLLLGFVVVKAALAALAAVVMRFPPRAAWLAGIGLGQFGEFGFVLLQMGQAAGLTSTVVASSLLSAGIISMFLTPVVMRLAPHITAGERLLASLTRFLGVRGIEQLASEEHLRRHVVVIGYGVAGRLVARALTGSSVRHVVLEMNAETVRRARDAKEPVYYADATSAEALAHAQVTEARVVVVLINDPQAAMRVVSTVHRVAPKVPVVIRTRYQNERARLLALGATDVIAEEAEASVEVLARLLRRLEVPRNIIVDEIRRARDVMHTSDRKITLPQRMLPEHESLAELKIDSVLIRATSAAVGKSAVELDVRQQTGALVVAMRRGESLLAEPGANERFVPGDVVFLVGSGEAVRQAMELLAGSADAGATSPHVA